MDCLAPLFPHCTIVQHSTVIGPMTGRESTTCIRPGARRARKTRKKARTRVAYHIARYAHIARCRRPAVLQHAARLPWLPQPPLLSQSLLDGVHEAACPIRQNTLKKRMVRQLPLRRPMRARSLTLPLPSALSLPPSLSALPLSLPFLRPSSSTASTRAARGRAATRTAPSSRSRRAWCATWAARPAANGARTRC